MGIERRGIEVVPVEERKQRAFGLIMTWFGFGIIASAMLVASISIGLGNTGLVLASQILGALIVAFYMAPSAWMGAEQGLPGSVIVRAALGTRGYQLVTWPLWLACFGWYGIQDALVSYSIDGILSAINPAWGGHVEIWLIVMGIVMAIFAIYGIHYVITFQKIATSILLVAVAIMSVLVAQSWGYIPWTYTPPYTIDFGSAVDLQPAATIALSFLAADTSRYALTPGLAATTCFSVMAIAFSLMAILGTLNAIIVGTWNIVEVVVGRGWGILGLLFIILGSWTTNVMNIYWGGISFSNITYGKLSRIRATLVTAVLGIITAIVGIFTLQGLITFFSLLSILIAPGAGILFADYYVIRKRKLQVEALYETKGPYYYVKGFNPAGVITWIMGVLYNYFAPSAFIKTLSTVILCFIIYIVLYKLFYGKSQP